MPVSMCMRIYKLLFLRRRLLFAITYICIPIEPRTSDFYRTNKRLTLTNTVYIYIYICGYFFLFIYQIVFYWINYI